MFAKLNGNETAKMIYSQGEFLVKDSCLFSSAFKGFFSMMNVNIIFLYGQKLKVNKDKKGNSNFLLSISVHPSNIVTIKL
jgi:hypothetical protein